ncbi:hypothetical protein OXYTRIMIC_694 [Oxytricha trifallax]|uniref:Uncharacterized protein n=1 Tax=Oxytricha trifallax TaxID=1172189 RepID=A0A073HX64_9SPIT|nr:hypothetical protein OXYTRIMIC_694 [Oxytricha trifallax]
MEGRQPEQTPYQSKKKDWEEDEEEKEEEKNASKQKKVDSKRKMRKANEIAPYYQHRDGSDSDDQDQNRPDESSMFDDLNF